VNRVSSMIDNEKYHFASVGNLAVQEHTYQRIRISHYAGALVALHAPDTAPQIGFIENEVLTCMEAFLAQDTLSVFPDAEDNLIISPNELANGTHCGASEVSQSHTTAGIPETGSILYISGTLCSSRSLWWCCCLCPKRL